MTPANSKIHVLVVDDSAFMRKAIVRMLSTADDIEVVGIARSGQEAIDLAARLHPDVVTLDVMMPDINGIEVLRRIMANRPTPVLMLSRLTTEGAATTLEALEAGAIDVIDKPADLMYMNVFQISETLIRKVRTAAGVDPRRLRDSAHEAGGDALVAAAASETGDDRGRGACVSDFDVVVIGTSTGGPPALQRVLSAIPSWFPCAIVVVQHMPPGFTEALAERLDRYCPLPVRHARTGDIIQCGRVLVAPSGWQFHFDRRPKAVTVLLDKRPRDTTHMPSVDVTMESAAQVYGERALGVLLTGMGSDGAQGMVAMRKCGGRTIAEAESSAIIWGMPRAAIEAGGASEVHDLHDIPTRIVQAVRGTG